MAEQDLTPKISDFITNEVQAVGRFRDALADLLELHAEYEDNGYFAIITQDHVIGENVHMTPTLAANVFSSVLAINTFMENNFHDDVLAQAAR
jgi:hypothetical protein